MIHRPLWLAILGIIARGCAEILVPLPAGAAAAGADWTTIVPTLRSAVAQLRIQVDTHHSTLICSAAVVGQRHLLTEAHCVDTPGGSFTADQISVVIAARDGELVLLASKGFATWWVPLKIRTAPLRVGDAVAAYGYGLAGGSPTFTAGVVASLSDVRINTIFPRAMLLDLTVLPGHSGGPIVDHQGRLVSVVRGAVMKEGQEAHYLARAEQHALVVKFLRRYLSEK